MALAEDVPAPAPSGESGTTEGTGAHSSSGHVEGFHAGAVGEGDRMGAAGLKPRVQTCTLRTENQGRGLRPVQLPIRNNLQRAIGLRHEGGYHLHLLVCQIPDLALHLAHSTLTIGSEAVMRQLQKGTGGGSQHLGTQWVGTAPHPDRINICSQRCAKQGAEVAGILNPIQQQLQAGRWRRGWKRVQ